MLTGPRGEGGVVAAIDALRRHHRRAGRWSRVLVDQLRRRGGVQVIEEGPGALRTVRAALRRGALVGFAVPYAFAFAALMTGELGTTWFRTTRR